MPKFDNDVKLDFKDVLIRPRRNTLKSRSEVDIKRNFKFRNSKHEFEAVPIIAANMDTIGTFEMAISLSKHSLLTAIHKHYSEEEWIKFAKENPDTLKFVAFSSGTSDSDFAKLEKLVNVIPEIKFICIDVANGYSETFVDYVKKTRSKFPNHTIIAGNVVTAEMVEELILAGADIIKVGIGPGSVCTTRKMTGVGFPQLSAVVDCAYAAHGLGGHIISDGGCCVAGDICKAFGAGADFVMLGGMLSGHEECAGSKIMKDGNYYKIFYGMSSTTAMEKYHGGVAEYRASEGKTVTVPYRGNVESTIFDILGGLRSACSYVGAQKLKDLPHNTTFIRVTQQTNEIFKILEIEEERRRKQTICN